MNPQSINLGLPTPISSTGLSMSCGRSGGAVNDGRIATPGEIAYERQFRAIGADTYFVLMRTANRCSAPLASPLR